MNRRIVIIISLILSFSAWCAGCSSGSSTNITPKCKTDEDCKGGEMCLPDTKQCVKICYRDSDCFNGQSCVKGACVTPSADGDAAEDEYPEYEWEPPVDNADDWIWDNNDQIDDVLSDDPAERDEQTAQCLSNGDCPLEQICVNRVCAPGCASARDCGTAKKCNTAYPPNGLCVECLADGDCGPGKACLNNACAFVCVSNADCAGAPNGKYCEPSSRVCVQCLDDSACSQGYICFENKCVGGCKGDRDCASDMKCDPSFGAHGNCFECVTNNHCPVGKVCSNHSCVTDCSAVTCNAPTPYCLPATGACVQCLSDENCPRGYVCSGNNCAAGCKQNADCPTGKYCDAAANGGQGKCVECLETSQCPSDKKCLNNVCQSSSGCSTDPECGAGYYCHPKTAQCVQLPADYCDPNISNSCNYYSGCDPLTRTCISSCMGLPICLFDQNRIWCVDGLCYGCENDAQCVGTACNKFDQMCVVCQSDADCSPSSYHCKTDSGNCYQCLDDSHCSNGKICDVDNGRKCVECLQNSDCKNAGKPVCGKDKTCIPPCSDECVKDATKCDAADTTPPIAYLTCADYDNDPCLEWGGSANCPTGQTCSANKCACLNECVLNAQTCDSQDSTKIYICKKDSYGCLYWSTNYCATGKYCSNGYCY